MKTSTDMERRLVGQYARLLRVSILSEWVHTPAQNRLLSWCILARYRDLVALGRAKEAEALLTWRDAERARMQRLNGRAA